MLLQEREVLHVLRRTLLGHHLQHNYATKNAFLYSKPDNTLHGYIVPHCACVLLTVGQRREGLALDIDPAVANSVLPPAGRDHPAHVAGGATPWEICALHNDP